jgi:hypothetical protein
VGSSIKRLIIDSEIRLTATVPPKTKKTINRDVIGYVWELDPFLIMLVVGSSKERDSER